MNSRAEELKVLTDSLEEVLNMRFPAHDNCNSGFKEWVTKRNDALDFLFGQINALLGEGK